MQENIYSFVVSNFKFHIMNREDYSYSIASNLLQIGAIKFNFKDYFTWTSGLKSPVYCDNRASLSFVKIRSLIKDAYIQVIQEKFPDVEVIAGVATGAIAQGALVADKLGLSFVYVRSNTKDCGLKKVIEGEIHEGQKTVIIEDHVSTGQSSLKVLEELRKAGVDVLGMVAIFSYELPVAEKSFHENSCDLYTLSTFSILKKIALKEGYITKEELNKLNEWHEDMKMDVMRR